MNCQQLDEAWLKRHPLPAIAQGADKNSRGRVLVVGGAEFVPGALRLTGEAALRAGAGKLQLATVRSSALSLGVLVPEAAMIALPADEDGEIAPAAAEILKDRITTCDTLVLGPGMSMGKGARAFIANLLDSLNFPGSLILDAAALVSLRDFDPSRWRVSKNVIFTPHHGEMAALSGLPIEEIKARPAAIAAEMAVRWNAVILLKGDISYLATAEGQYLVYEGGCVGLGTGGSGDVLAGLIGGLASRGATAFQAAAWGAWIHGKAGNILAETIGEVGFLARELLPVIPALIEQTMRTLGPPEDILP
ncbi:Bifunctional NAD(P)H-hydrate repair enzyme Nnr [Sphingobium sp. AntQ-1]|uniref:NAD(P)H-hydrate dehydratase n=1 Tax=Sphingobium sp. AntQ-1 TaxID=2930091 RepID=UPI00234E8C97|nr:NAD(P)H-hydrate dehydratase [Sphingobium sp. AntQ-1]WCP13347.1 Bifunctional NAD(P)H-hydrate repair enzyme Nnr [Sphingobium sp. AntQ-1]